MDLIECLGGVEGRLDETEGRLEMAPLTVGWGVSVELIGLVISLILLPLSIVAGLVTLAIGATLSVHSTGQRNQKNVCVFFLQSSLAVLQPEAQNEKVETLV